MQTETWGQQGEQVLAALGGGGDGQSNRARSADRNLDETPLAGYHVGRLR